MSRWMIVYILVGCVAFFPAYLGYRPEHARVGYICTIAFACSTYIPYIRDHGRMGISAIIALSLFGYLIESIGIMTCWPYGCFSYSEQMGEKLWGLVPYMLAFTRPPLVIGVWFSLQKHIFGHRWMSYIYGGLGLVMIDLILDPLAVLMGLWSYTDGGWRRGVPWTNFAGWMLSGTIGMMIVGMIANPSQSSLCQGRGGKGLEDKAYTHGLRLTMSFFVGYGIRRYFITM